MVFAWGWKRRSILGKELPVAQKVQVLLVDDLDGGEAVETLTFALDGISYEIDLSRDHAQALRDAMAPYLGSARKANGRAAAGTRGRRGAGAQRSGGSTTNTAEIRQWAKDNGHAVSERGRIPGVVIEAYEKAHG
jgi:hypothetical protein